MQWFAKPFQLIFNWIQYKDEIFNVQTDSSLLNFIVFCKHSLILNFILQHVPKLLGQQHVAACYIPFPLATLSKRLGTDGTNCRCVVGGILFHSCFSCSTVWGLHCCILCFIMLHTFSVGQFWTAGRPVWQWQSETICTCALLNGRM